MTFGHTRSYRKAMTVKSSISLTDSQYAYAQELVILGQFPSVSAVLQHALEQMRTAREIEEAETLALRQALTARLAGPTRTAKEAQDALRDVLSRERGRTLGR